MTKSGSNEQEEPIFVGKRMEPETIDVILENRNLTAEEAALCAELSETRAENERLKDACVKQQHDIQQTFGKALGYPRFPADFNAGDQVCVGDHVAESLAMEVAKQLATLTERLAAAERLVDAAVSFRFSIDQDIKVHIYPEAPIGRTEWTWVANLEQGKWGPPKYSRGHATKLAAYQAAIAAGWLPQGEKGGGW